MRNLEEYPITREEILTTLRRTLEAHQMAEASTPPGLLPIGDITILCLQKAIEFIDNEMPEVPK